MSGEAILPGYYQATCAQAKFSQQNKVIICRFAITLTPPRIRGGNGFLEMETLQISRE